MDALWGLLLLPAYFALYDARARYYVVRLA